MITYEAKQAIKKMNEICKADLSSLNPTLRNAYANAYISASKLLGETRSDVVSGDNAASRESLLEVEWSDFDRLSEKSQALVNQITIFSMNKEIYSIAVALLLEKIEHPERDIGKRSDKPLSKHGWGKDGFSLSDIMRKEISPFFHDMDFDESKANGNYFEANSLKYNFPDVPYGEDYIKEAGITDKALQAVMFIVDDVRKNGASPESYLEALFTRSIYKRMDMDKRLSGFAVRQDLNIKPSEALEIIDRHRDAGSYSQNECLKNISNLPVRAIWSYFECRTEGNPYFPRNLSLDIYHPHNATDTIDSPGDICLRSKLDGLVYECIDVKGYGKKLTWEDVSSALTSKIIPAIETGALRGGYRYIYTDEPSIKEKNLIERNLADISERWGISISIISFDDYFARGNYSRLSGVNCRQWLDTYQKEIEQDRYKELPYVLKTTLVDIYKEADIAVEQAKAHIPDRIHHNDFSRGRDAMEFEK